MRLRRFSRGARALLWTSVLALAMVLSGCVQVEFASEFESDGSARHSVSTLVDRSLLDDEMLGGELDFDAMEEEARDSGLDVERIDDADQVGVRVSMEVEDNEDLGAAMNELFNAMDSEAEPADIFSGSFTESGGGFSATTYSFALTVDGDKLLDDGEDELEDEFDMGFGADMMRQFINLTYTVSMPGEIVEHNGTAVGTSQVQWELPFEGSQTFTAESEEGSGMPLGLILGVGVGFLALMLLILGGIVVMRSRTAPIQPAPAAAGASAAGVHPVMPVDAAASTDGLEDDRDQVIDADTEPGGPKLDQR